MLPYIKGTSTKQPLGSKLRRIQTAFAHQFAISDDGKQGGVAQSHCSDWAAAAANFAMLPLGKPRFEYRYPRGESYLAGWDLKMHVSR